MTSQTAHKKRFRQPYLMTAYQFVFFTFYQIIQGISRSGMKAYRAALLVCALQAWLIFVIIRVVGVLVHPAYVPSLSTLLAVSVPVCLVVYFAVFEHGPWQEYVEYFEQLPKRTLIVGRLLVLATVLGLFTMIALLTGFSQR